MSRRLLVLGAGAHREQAFATWARAGIEVTLVDGFSHHRYERLVTHNLLLDVRDEAGLTDGGLGDLARNQDGVVALADGCLIAAARTAELAGWPGPGERAARLCRDKAALRATLAHEGVGAPQFARVLAEADAAVFCEHHAPPYVLKPIDNAGSTGVFQCGSWSDVRARLAGVLSFSPARVAIIETLLDGPEISVEGVVKDGELVVALLTDKETTSAPTFIEVQHIHPAPVSGSLEAAIREATQQVVDILDIESAAVHAEFKIGDAGPVLVEIATRLGGDMIPDLALVSGVFDMYSALAELALDERGPMRPARPRTRYAGVRYVVGSGEVQAFVEPATIARDRPDAILAANQLFPRGHRISEELVANWNRAAYVLAASEDLAELRSVLRHACGQFADKLGVEQLLA